MKRGDASQNILLTESRDNLWHALTPQFFPLMTLRDALRNAAQQGVQITDEASAIEWAQGTVSLIEGRASNIKVTQPEDLQLAEFYLQHKANL
jgi:2-C-methyl-D-erythritol 4-phosphate cytidylyltransferase